MNKHLTDWLSQFKQICGDNAVINDPAEMAPYLSDWRKRYTGQALAVLCPTTANEVADVVKLCIEHRISITPQGGNTGLVGGAVSLDDNGIVLCTKRLKSTALVDVPNRTCTISAGFPLYEVQQLADQAGLLFPLSLASEGSCTIGGNLSTNAGGTAVLRYGNTRELVLGIEAVLPNGEIYSDLQGLRKNNTGYDLKQLLIGAEGTLGIITAATLKLFAKPHHYVCAWVGVLHTQAAIDLLAAALNTFDAQLTSFEYIQHAAVALVVQHFHKQLPIHTQPEYVLLELSCFDSDPQKVTELLQHLLATTLTAGIITDAVIAQNEEQRKNLWALREQISEAQAKEGLNLKHDISLPISKIPDFLAGTLPILNQHTPGVRPIFFGHLGDGNLHFNISAPLGENPSQFLKNKESQINTLVHDAITRFGGSISAEHGIGLLKREALLHYKSKTAIAAMQAIKQALDPLNLMNPGKVI